MGDLCAVLLLDLSGRSVCGETAAQEVAQFCVDCHHRVRRGSHRDAWSQLRFGDTVRETFNTDCWPRVDLNPCLVHCASRRLHDFCAGLCGNVYPSSRTRGDSGDVCDRRFCAAIDVAVNRLKAVRNPLSELVEPD